MSQKRRKPRVQYELLTLQVEDYSVTVNATISYQAREPRPKSDKIRLYSFGHTIEIVGTCTAPDERARETYRIIMEPPVGDEPPFDATLSDVRVKDDNGLVKHRKVQGQVVPVYDIPEGLGLLGRKRGPIKWEGSVWLPEPTLMQTMIVLANKHPLYLQIHERKIDRMRWINGLTLQTTNPLGDR